MTTTARLKHSRSFDLDTERWFCRFQEFIKNEVNAPLLRGKRQNSNDSLTIMPSHTVKFKKMLEIGRRYKYARVQYPRKQHYGENNISSVECFCRVAWNSRSKTDSFQLFLFTKKTGFEISFWHPKDNFIRVEVHTIQRWCRSQLHDCMKGNN